jgi:hypothetical protein
MELNYDQNELGAILASGMRGFAISQHSVEVTNFASPASLHEPEMADAFAVLLGNDEFPFIMTIPK